MAGIVGIGMGGMFMQEYAKYQQDKTWLELTNMIKNKIKLVIFFVYKLNKSHIINY